MQSVLSEIQNTFLRSKIRNGDGIDQLHHMVTVFALTAFAAVIVVLEYVGEPINCWTYGENAGKHQEHVNQYCWTHSLYHYPDLSNRSVMPYALNQMGGPEVVQLKEEASGRITFYRWGTAIFLFQALMFKLPSLLWGEYSSYFGCNIVQMVEVFQEMVFAKDRKEKLQEVALFLDKWLDIYRKNNRFPICCKKEPQATAPVSSNKLPFVYLMTKLGFFVNNLFQFYFLSAFLMINFWTYGVDTIESHAFSEEVPESSTSKTYFPTLAICHFRTYDQGTSAGHPIAKGKWVQCILRVNIFLEKMFLVEWFWFLLLLVLTIVSIGYWSYKILSQEAAIQYVQRLTKLKGQDTKTVDECKCIQEIVQRLSKLMKQDTMTVDECKCIHEIVQRLAKPTRQDTETADECIKEIVQRLSKPKGQDTKTDDKFIKENGQTDENKCKNFVENYLCNDGVFILRILATNTNEVIVAELLEPLWDLHNKKRNDGSYKPNARKGNWSRFCSCFEHHTEDETEPLTNLPQLKMGNPQNHHSI